MITVPSWEWQRFSAPLAVQDAALYKAERDAKRAEYLRMLLAQACEAAGDAEEAAWFRCSP